MASSSIMPEKVPTDKSPILKRVGITEGHCLQTGWKLWYHNPSDMDWSMKSYKLVFPMTIHYLEELIILFNSWDLCLPRTAEGMFFLMRCPTADTTIFPRWEDENNKNGGYWSFKITKDMSDEVWKKMCFLTVNESICLNWDTINGISISPKKNFCIVKIWNRSSSERDVKTLSDEIKFLNIDECLYSSHNDNIKKDKDKLARKRQYRRNKYNKKSPYKNRHRHHY